MPDVFISHSSTDLDFAKAVERQLKQEGIDVFLAPISLMPGCSWTKEILDNLRASPWVLFFASRAACKSHYVQQEIGGALLTNKKIIPIVWDMPPSALPGWVDQIHAIDLSGATVDGIRQAITSISERIKADKRNGLMVVSALLFALMAFGK